MKTLIAARMERCIGCQSCSLACARLVHGRLSWYTAGIRIGSSGGISTGFEARVCLACDPPPCAAACPTGALTPRKSDGGIKQDKKLCIRCGKCVAACPIGAIVQDEQQNPYVCIHCGRCVPYCPHDCLELAEKGKANVVQEVAE
jgi:Fe-S-cluster-containing dehydrogenase component